MTGIHFLGCKCCGTYDRHNEIAQVAFAFFKYEMKFSGSTGSFDSHFVGISAKGHTRASTQTDRSGALLSEKSGL